MSEPRNPPWSRDELILALDLYLRRRSPVPDEHDPEVTELSALLNKMAGPGTAVFKNYRSPSAVAMKIANFQSIDPSYTKTGKKGLPRGAKGDEEVWADFSAKPAELRDASGAIRAAVAGGNILTPEDGSEEDDDEAPEGRILAHMHKRRERSRKLITRKKKSVLKHTGKLACEACGFEFKTYGSRGDGFIEVHHTKPLHELRPGDKTRLKDLAVLCANCHRILHIRRPWLTLDELKQIAPQSHG